MFLSHSVLLLFTNSFSREIIRLLEGMLVGMEAKKMQGVSGSSFEEEVLLFASPNVKRELFSRLRAWVLGTRGGQVRLSRSVVAGGVHVAEVGKFLLFDI